MMTRNSLERYYEKVGTRVALRACSVLWIVQYSEYLSRNQLYFIPRLGLSQTSVPETDNTVI